MTLELTCEHCGLLFIRWKDDPVYFPGAAKPWDGQQLAVRIEAPGSYQRASDGKWYRWAPGPAARLPDGEIWTRYVSGCGHVQVRVDKLEDAADAKMRQMGENGESFATLTADSLLRSFA